MLGVAGADKPGKHAAVAGRHRRLASCRAAPLEEHGGLPPSVPAGSWAFALLHFAFAALLVRLTCPNCTSPPFCGLRLTRAEPGWSVHHVALGCPHALPVCSFFPPFVQPCSQPDRLSCCFLQPAAEPTHTGSPWCCMAHLCPSPVAHARMTTPHAVPEAVGPTCSAVK